MLVIKQSYNNINPNAQEEFFKTSTPKLSKEEIQKNSKIFFDENLTNEALEALNLLKPRQRDECLINIAEKYATENNLGNVIVVINNITKEYNKDIAINKTARVFVDMFNYKTANELIDLSNDPDKIQLDIALDVAHFRDTLLV